LSKKIETANMKHCKFVFCFILFLYHYSVIAQSEAQDSLTALLTSVKSDSTKVNIYIELCRLTVNSNPEQTIQYANSAKELAYKIDYQKGLAYAYKFIGLGYNNKAMYVDAMDQYKKSLLLFELIKDPKGIANLYNNIGNIYYYQGENTKAAELYLKALKIAEQIDDKNRIAVLSNNLGGIYNTKRSTYYKALDYYLKALKQGEILKDQSIIGASSVNIGSIYFDQGNRAKGLKYYQKSLDANKGTIYYSSSLNAIAATYFKNRDFKTAITYYDEAIKTAESFDDKLEMTKAIAGLGEIYSKMKEFKKSIEYYHKAILLAKEIGGNEQLIDIYKGLSYASNGIGNFKDAYIYYNFYSQLKDSIYNVESDKKTAFLQGSFDLEKKEAQIKLLKKDNELSTKEIKSKQAIQIALLAFLAAVSVLLVFVYRFYIIKKKSNIELEEKNKKIESQKSEITKSIEYAQKIQHAMLPEEELIEEVLYHSFLFYQPKDIVSGDFYICIKEKDIIYLAVADCTGHGVPGALMSMIGGNILNKLITDKGLTDPADILTQLNDELIISLKQNKNAGNDGMDIAFCAIDFKNKLLKFAGAYRPIYMVRGSDLTEIKGSKFPIGGHQIHEERQFKTITIDLWLGDKFYIGTDGYSDQFGGEFGKKLTTKKFKEFILSIKDKHIKQQGLLFQNFFSKWKGTNDQLDDICLLGFEVIDVK